MNAVVRAEEPDPPLNDDDRELGFSVYHLYVVDAGAGGLARGRSWTRWPWRRPLPRRRRRSRRRRSPSGLRIGVGSGGRRRGRLPSLLSGSRGRHGRVDDGRRPGGRGRDHVPHPREDPRAAGPRPLHRRGGRGADRAQAPGLRRRRRGSTRELLARLMARQPQLEHLHRLPDRDPPRGPRRAAGGAAQEAGAALGAALHRPPPEPPGPDQPLPPLPRPQPRARAGAPAGRARRRCATAWTRCRRNATRRRRPARG